MILFQALKKPETIASASRTEKNTTDTITNIITINNNTNNNTNTTNNYNTNDTNNNNNNNDINNHDINKKNHHNNKPYIPTFASMTMKAKRKKEYNGQKGPANNIHK